MLAAGAAQLAVSNLDTCQKVKLSFGIIGSYHGA